MVDSVAEVEPAAGRHLSENTLRRLQFQLLQHNPAADPRKAFGTVDWTLMQHIAVPENGVSEASAATLLCGLSGVTALTSKADVSRVCFDYLKAKGLRMSPQIVKFWNGNLRDRTERSELNIFVADTVAVVKDMIADPRCEQSIGFKPKFNSSGERVYGPAWSAQWYERESEHLPHGTHLYSVDGFLDKSDQSGTTLYPFCFVSNHLTKDERHKPEHTRIVALIDPHKFPQTADGKRASAAYYQAVLDIILLRLETEGDGFVTTPDAAGLLAHPRTSSSYLTLTPHRHTLTVPKLALVSTYHHPDPNLMPTSMAQVR